MIDRTLYPREVKFRFNCPGNSHHGSVVEIYGYTSANIRVATPCGKGLLVSPARLEPIS